MTAVLIIVGIVALILIIRAINAKGGNKSEMQNLLEKMQKDIFPNGKQDIAEGTETLRRILNYSIDEKTAQDIFIKSSSICYTSGMNGEFDKERLKQHLAPYALMYFDNQTLISFYEYLLSKNERANFFNVMKNFLQISNPNGTDQDEMPEGYGEFGLEITNPIPTASIPQNRLYLDRLRTIDNIAVTYDRIGSMKAKNIQSLIDGYKIFANGKQIAILYICPYNKRTSIKAPKGFKLV
ncbi:MAG: hypothetical protein LBE13_12740 [Bacteroidales bacterium]|jgi:hypothetical protein|nr:hypothetical protein [Bacteroidales bacterium]